MQRKLTAIMSADVVGYSALMEADEAGTLERLKANRSKVFDPHVTIHGGRVFKLIGDGALAEFPSVIAAVECALAIQQATDADDGGEKRIRYRIGINLGEVVVEGDDIYGEGVNVAARIQALAPVGGVALSRVVKDQIEGKARCSLEDMGEHTVKNIERPVHVFCAHAASAALETRTSGVAQKPLFTKPSIAVLAFDNLSGEPEATYFCDGISEEILQTVARSTDLKVIARSSSFQYRGAGKAIRHVAAELKTTHVLDGSVRRSGNRVRISANLIECASQETLWSDRFDREIADVFALQDEIAGAVATALKIAFAPTDQGDAIDPAAYNLYLKALEIRNKGLETDTRRTAVRMLEEATGRAPKFARAWALLATMLAQSRDDEPEEHDIAWRESVVRAAETALKLDPALGIACQALGQLEPIASYSEREALHQRALSVAPNDPTVLTNASLFFAEIGRIRDSLEYAKHAHDLDPMSPWAANWYANTLALAGRQEDCHALFIRLCALWPDNELLARDALYCAIGLRDWTWFDELIAIVRNRKLDSPALRRVISYGTTLRDSHADLQALLLKRARDDLARANFVPVSDYAVLYGVGLTNEVYELMDQSSFAFMFNRHMRPPSGGISDGYIFSALSDTSMIRDIRFVRLCAKLGLCEYWTKTDRWPDCAAAVAPFYDFKAEAERLAMADPQ